MAKYQERCRICGRPILLLETYKGRRIPCDPEPVYFAPQIWSSRRFVMPDASTFSGEPVAEDDPDAHLGYSFHRDTCRRYKGSRPGIPKKRR